MGSKIYLDCTHTYNSDLHTGIQRVVKNLVYNLKTVSKELDVEIYPVFLKKDQFYKFSEFPELTKTSPNKVTIKSKLKKIYKYCKNLAYKILPDKLSSLLDSPKLTIFLNHIVDNMLFSQKIDPSKAVDFEKNDILILADSTWFNNHKVLEELKNNEVKIVSIIYDFIPLIYPQFCDKHLVEAFREWYSKSSKYVDYFVAISKTVRDDAYKYIKNNFNNSVKYENFDYFYLGADFKTDTYNESNIDEEFRAVFNKKSFISVSTIEPRKNHKYILEAFEVLWSKKIDVNLVIIGKVGWLVDEFIELVRAHKEYKKHLFLLNDVDDEHLVYAYKNSSALIMASFVEGFGLPIIESLNFRLPVLASNIPIHNEIGEGFVTFFDLDDKHSLADMILNEEYLSKNSSIKWLSWHDSCYQLIEKTITLTQNEKI